jgi:hypothetical protein
MTHTDAGKIIDIARSAGLPILLYGAEGTGKTGLCRHLFPDARIILEEELRMNGLSLLNSIAKVSRELIFENLTDETLQVILPVVKNRTLYGEKLENFFLFTARTEPRIAGDLLKIELFGPSAHEWLNWADGIAVHTLVKELVAEHNALATFRPRQLETLSRLLNRGIPSELLDELIAPLVDHNTELMAKIRGGYDEAIDFDKVISLEGDAFINRIKQTSSKNIDLFNETLIQEIRFDESIVTKEKLIAYISSMNSRQSMELLSGLLESEGSFDYLNELLEDTGIRRKIDEMIG